MSLRIAALVSLLLLTAGCRPEPAAEINAADAAPTRASALPAPAAQDWPSWRGPNLNGTQPDANPPLEWSPTQNVRWKSPLPGRGHSSPIVRGEQVFVGTSDESAKTQSLVAFNTSDGAELWTRVVHTGGLDHHHEKNTAASATPACDGEKVYITFLNKQAIWLSAVDLKGNIVWQRDVGPFSTVHGYAASPALFKHLVVVAGDSNRGGFLGAVDRASGDIVWRVPRKAKTSFSSPVVANVAGRDQVLMNGAGSVDAYNPLTGERLWYYTGGPTDTTSGTVSFDADHVYASGGFPGKQTVCLKADGSGDVTNSHVVWKNDQKFYVPSMLIHDGRLYGVTDNGVAYVYDATTGQQLDVQRLGGDFSASPTLAGKHLYATNESGRTYVLEPGDKLKVIAQNDLGESCLASPAVSGDRLFLRTEGNVVCVASGQQ
jgi:outer membrane protein assembly factor BamB